MAVTLFVGEQHRFLVSSIAFVLALLVAQTRVESGIHSGVEVPYGAVLGSLDDPRPLPGLRDEPPSCVERADAAAARAYAPYSGYLVGAAVRTRDGKLFEGVNVENAAYPLGVCAEKSAIVAAVAAGYRPGDLEAIGITASPCGGCRQWLHEFRVDGSSYRRANGEIVDATPGRPAARHLGPAR